MGRFSKYRSHYNVPERISPENARLNRINAALQKNLELQRRFGRLSRDNEDNRLVTSRRLDNDLKVRGQKPDLRAGALALKLSMFSERDFSDPARRSEYRRLRAAQQGVKSQPAGADKRQQYAKISSGARTVYGGPAFVSSVKHNLLNANSWAPVFQNIPSVLPCVERAVRREVMFAIGFGGRGSHKKKRRTENSGVPC